MAIVPSNTNPFAVPQLALPASTTSTPFTVAVPTTTYRFGQSDLFTPPPALAAASPIRALPPPAAAQVPTAPAAFTPPPTAAASAGAAPTAAAEAGAVRNLAPGAGVMEGGVSLFGNGGRLAAAAGTAGRMLQNPFVAPFLMDPIGDWVAERTGSDRLGGAIEDAGTAALIGSRWGPWGALAGGAAGGIAGALGYQLEDIPIIGAIFGEGEQVDPGDLEDRVNDQYNRVLGQYGATPEFIQRAQAQFRLAWQTMGGDQGLPPEQVNSLATDVLNGMVQQWQVEQSGGPYDPFGDAREQLDQAREYDLAQFAATQAWMQPLVTNIVDQQQQYANAYRDAGLSLAGQISDPAVAAAFEQLAHSYSNDQATQNAVMVQQMALAPQMMQQQLDTQYQGILQDLQLQEAQYNNEILAAGGTLPGATPIIGGIPLIDPSSIPPAQSGTVWSPGGIPTASSSGHVIDLRDQPQSGGAPPGWQYIDGAWYNASGQLMGHSTTEDAPIIEPASPVPTATTTTTTVPPTAPASDMYTPTSQLPQLPTTTTPMPTQPASVPPTGTTLPGDPYEAILAPLGPNPTASQIVIALMNAGVPGQEAELVAQQRSGTEISGFRRAG